MLTSVPAKNTQTGAGMTFNNRPGRADSTKSAARQPTPSAKTWGLIDRTW